MLRAPPVVTGAGVVVFDALGSPSLARLLLGKIRAVTDEPIVRVIVSHYAPDHIYGLQVFAGLDAEILAPEGSGEYLKSPRARRRLARRRVTLEPWVNEHTRLVSPDRYLAEDLRFRLGDVEFNVAILGNAHPDGDLALFILPDQVLFAGDIVFDGVVPILGDADIHHWLELLERMDRAQPAALVPGHGAMVKHAPRAIDFTRRYLEHLRATMGMAVQELVPFDEAYARVDWREYEDLPGFAEANRCNASRVYQSLEAAALREKSSPAN
jgi:glyoxylase-like metal-dependent hydrolase (beta-lactamase superfamily II)